MQVRKIIFMKDCLDDGQGILFDTLQSLCGLN